MKVGASFGKQAGTAYLGHATKKLSSRDTGATCPSAKVQLPLPATTLPIEQGIPNAKGVMMDDIYHIVAGKAQKVRFCEILLGFLDDVDAARRD